jgi:hypothetical protein
VSDLMLFWQFIWMMAFGWFFGRKLIRMRRVAKHRVLVWMLRVVGWFWFFVFGFTALFTLGEMDVRGGIGWLMANVVVLIAFGVVWSMAVISTLVAWKEIRAYRAQKKAGGEVDDGPLLDIGPREVYEDIRDVIMERRRGR